MVNLFRMAKHWNSFEGYCILAILIFHFKLIHIPGTMHSPDGLLRQPLQPNDEPPDYEAEEEEVDNWIDHLYSFMHLINDSPIAVQRQRHKRVAAFKTTVHSVFVNNFVEPTEFSSYNGVPCSVKAQLKDDKMVKVIKFHNDLEWPMNMDDMTYNKFV